MKILNPVLLSLTGEKKNRNRDRFRFRDPFWGPAQAIPTLEIWEAAEKKSRPGWKWQGDNWTKCNKTTVVLSVKHTCIKNVISILVSAVASRGAEKTKWEKPIVSRGGYPSHPCSCPVPETPEYPELLIHSFSQRFRFFIGMPISLASFCALFRLPCFIQSFLSLCDPRVSEQKRTLHYYSRSLGGKCSVI